MFLQIKVGHIIPVTIIKAIPDYDWYLVMVVGSELMAFLPKKYAQQQYKVGDDTMAAIFTIEKNKIILSQRSHQYFKKLLMGACASLIQEGKIKFKRITVVSTGQFVKVAVEAPNALESENPIKMCIPHILNIKKETGFAITLVKYSEKIKEYIVNALYPAPADRIKKVIYLREANTADVYVDSPVVGLFLGKNGANAAAAAKLTGVTINIMPYREVIL